MKYSEIDFNLENNVFTHTVGEDYSYFALWKSARPFISEIRNYLENNFEILLETNIIWSEENFDQNAARLYEVPIYKDGNNFFIPTNHGDKIGDTGFIVFVVKDSTPEYSYAPSVSGNIELSNLSIVKAKSIFREWISKENNSKYAVHSTNNIHEFFSQAPLLLGLPVFEAILDGKEIFIPSIQKDLMGADGWESYKELFEILRLTSNYLILRNFETLPFKNENNDLDILTDNYQHFASIVGAVQTQNKPYKATIEVAGEIVPLDIRFIGDNYYCDAWAKTILQNRILQSGIFIPKSDDYFFSLLYHVVVQKPFIEAHYKDVLKKLASNLKLSWFSEEMFLNEQRIFSIVKGYMTAKGYFFESPIDTTVYANKKVISQLSKRSSIVIKKSLKMNIKQAFLRFVPKRWYFYYLKFKTGRVHDFKK